jgi:hypothetical protein
MRDGVHVTCLHCGQSYFVRRLPLGPYVCSKRSCERAERTRTAQPARVEVVPGWTVEEILAREG